MRVLRVVAALVISALAFATVPAQAGDAAVELQRQADRVVTVLADRNTAAGDRQKEVRAIVTDAFDFEEAAKRTLGRAWAELKCRRSLPVHITAKGYLPKLARPPFKKRKKVVVRVYRKDTPDAPTVYRRGEAAEAEPALPGWTMPVDDLFDFE